MRAASNTMPCELPTLLIVLTMRNTMFYKNSRVKSCRTAPFRPRQGEVDRAAQSLSFPFGFLKALGVSWWKRPIRRSTLYRPEGVRRRGACPERSLRTATVLVPHREGESRSLRQIGRSPEQTRIATCTFLADGHHTGLRLPAAIPTSSVIFDIALVRYPSNEVFMAESCVFCKREVPTRGPLTISEFAN